MEMMTDKKYHTNVTDFKLGTETRENELTRAYHSRINN